MTHCVAAAVSVMDEIYAVCACGRAFQTWDGEPGESMESHLAYYGQLGEREVRDALARMARAGEQK